MQRPPKIFHTILLLLLAALFFAGCRGRLAPQPAPSVSQAAPSVQQTPAGTTNPALATTAPGDIPTTQQPVVSPAPNASPTADLAPIRPRYVLTATLNDRQHHLTVDERIDYTNNTSTPLEALLLMVEPAYYPGVFHLNQVKVGDSPAEPVWDGAQASLPLPTPLFPGQAAHVQIVFELALPSPQPSPGTRPVPFGYTARQTNLVDWYPFIPPYVEGKGWLAHPAGYFGEHLAYEQADFEVNLRLEDPDPQLIVAASASPVQVGDWQRYRLEAARDFVFSVSDEYQVLTETVGTVTVLGYAFPFHKQAGEAALKTTAQALALYQGLYGPYPHATLSVVEADFLDGMEYDGLFFLSNGFYNLYTGTPGEYLIAIAAHETAHEWFFGLVGNDQAMEPWLDEALCTYSERLYYEKVAPEGLDWWWAYRVNYYEPKGWVNGTIYDYGGLAEPFRTYRDAVYLNGAIFLENLRKSMGDEDFFAFLKDYVAQNAHRLATGEDFFRILDEHTRMDLTPLISQFFHP